MERGDNFKFFFDGKLFELNELSFNRENLPVLIFATFSGIYHIFHIVLLVNLLKFSFISDFRIAN
ncbi:MAG: hypothetical protein A2651_02960 [Candidatus Yanofskybacteria bacterium RIFCSPHIGHO2_01_FULL_42_12]|nr:MAG: hypothetical protein A2651_02960 [Candidatus Yanofskybacteria bacterium RIFCSPHIGHO2_01_FULL_42_12]